MKNTLPKIIVIVGPTASGKTDMGLALAKKYDGEIISADSRQVYKKMDIGTAKPEGRWLQCERDSSASFNSAQNDKAKAYIYEGVRHHLIDIVDPDSDFSLADFKKMAVEIIEDILKRGKLPIIVGGTGLYIWAIVDNLDIPNVQPDNSLRKELESRPLVDLVGMLEEADPEGAKKIDLKNPRRVIRALEVVLTSGQPFFSQQTKSEPLFEALQIGLNIPKEELYKRIDKRIDAQVNVGLVEEVNGLIKDGYSWNLPSMSSIGYRQIGMYVRGDLSLEEAMTILKTDTHKYAKRQMTWFKRDKRIHWIHNTDLSQAQQLVEKFLQR